MSEAPRTNDMTAQEHEVWLAVYMDAMKAERAKQTWNAQGRAAEAAKQAVLDYRGMSLRAVEPPPQEAANG